MTRFQHFFFGRLPLVTFLFQGIAKVGSAIGAIAKAVEVDEGHGSGDRDPLDDH